MNGISFPYTRGLESPSVFKHVRMGEELIVTGKRESSSEQGHRGTLFSFPVSRTLRSGVLLFVSQHAYSF